MRVIVVLAAAVMVLSAGGPRAVRADEGAEARAWADAALLGQAAATPSAAGLVLRRQDHGPFRMNRSVIDTPLRIGPKSYARGVGTHATSEILVRLPGPGRRLEADVGVDNNDDTGGTHGSVVFVVEAGGREIFRSGVLRGGEAPVRVGADLGGAREFTLRVFDGGDGTSWDHSDWAEASVMLENGERVWLDEMAAVTPGLGPATSVPFSFLYGGKSSVELLPLWQRAAAAPARAADGRERQTVTWTDPATGLEVAAEVTRFEGFPAVEWVLRFRNTGPADTPVLANLLPLDLRVQIQEQGSVVLHHAHGSTCTATDFVPVDQAVPPGGRIDLAPAGGRSSGPRPPGS